MPFLKEWIESKIRDEDITYFEYSEFSNISVIGKGGYGVVKRADLNSSGIQVALKSLLNPMTKESDIEELLRKNIDMICDEEESMLIVGKQVRNAFME